MKINNFDDVKLELKTKLSEYLQMFEIDTSRHFFCINPKHQETCPSCSIMPDNKELYHCFSCLETGDIYKAALHLEGLPEDGPDFVKVTVPTLAKKLGIHLEYSEITEEEKYRQRTYAAYQEAANYIANQPRSEIIQKEIERRHWNEELLKEENIGCVESYREFRNYLKGKDFEARFLDDIDLGRADIFNENNLIFSIKDEYGKTVGFSARNLYFEEEEKTFNDGNKIGISPKKYINSRCGTGPKCNIYQKSRRLYLIHKAKQFHPPLYITEGYSDALTLVQNGIQNVVAIGGTAFTEDHIDLLIQLKIKEIYLCLDGDKAGQERTEDILLKKFSKYRNFIVKVVQLPDGMDPDDYIRSYGKDKFLELPIFDSFEWLLRRYDDRVAPEKIIEDMLPLVIAEVSFIEREKMIRELSIYTGFSTEAISSEIGRYENHDKEERLGQIYNLGKWIDSEIRKAPDQVDLILAAGQDRANEIREECSTIDIFDQCFKSVLDSKKQEEERPSSIKALTFGPNLSEFGKIIEGNWSDSVIFYIGSPANCGKSLLLSQIASDLAKYNEDAIVVVQTIDDNKQQWEGKVLAYLAQKYISSTKPSYVTINKIRNPKYYTQEGIEDMEGNKYLMEIREKAYAMYTELIEKKRLVILDGVGVGPDGKGRCPDMKSAVAVLSSLRKKNPDKKIIWVLDNFHDLSDRVESAHTERERIKSLAKKMRDVVKRLRLICFSSIQYTKINAMERPQNINISESVDIEYAASMILHIYNPLHGYSQAGKGDLCDAYHEGKDWMKQLAHLDRMPLIELIIGKNKITSVKDRSLYFKMYPELALLEGITSEQHHVLVSEHQKQIEEDLEHNTLMKSRHLWNSEMIVDKQRKKWMKE